MNRREIITDVAQYVFDKFLAERLPHGQFPADWARNLSEIGCRVEAKVGCDSSYSPIRSITPSGLIIYDALAPILIQLRQIAHEAGHHCLLHWPPALATFETEALSEMGDAAWVEEQVCIEIEDLAAPLPVGIQRNGKLAAPRGVAVRHFSLISGGAAAKRLPESEADTGDGPDFAD